MSDKKDLDKIEKLENMIRLNRWLSISAIIITVLSFCISYEALEFNSVNFIIGVLAVLVAILIGWQVFNVINWDNKIKNDVNNYVDSKINRIDIKINKVFGLIERMSTTIYDKANFFLEILKMEKNREKIKLYLSKIENLTTEYPIPFSGGFKSNEIDQINSTQAKELLQKTNELPKDIQDSKEIKTLIKELERIKNRELEFPPF